MKQSTLKTPQVQRKSIVDNLAQALRVFSQAASSAVAKPQHLIFHAFCLVIIFSQLTFSEPRKAANLAGRGLSAPLWSPDDRFLAYTTVDLNELYVVELNIIEEKQSLYRVSNLEGVGHRFVFEPGEERLAFRAQAGALPTHADRIVSSSFYTHDPRMLTSNTEPVIGPYRIENKIFYRKNLKEPLTGLDGHSWSKGVYLDDGTLTTRDASQNVTFASKPGEKVEGFEISPDGEWVAAVFKLEADRQVRLIQISSGLVIDLGKGRWPSWSGDSNRIAIVRDKPEVKFAELVVYDLQVGQSRSVMGLNQFWPDEPALNNKGTRVAFVHDGEIYITEVTGF